MAPGIGASSIMGIAFEAVAGTYVAPTKFIPFLDESLGYNQDTKWRRPVRNSAAIIGAIAGDSHIEGDITIESLTDILPYFMYAARCAVVKTGAGPYTYACTQSNQALPTSLRTLSITVVRNGVAFGYTGCTVGNIKFSVDGGEFKFTISIVGRDELTQSVPTATWPTTTPYGAGQYSVQIPTASQVFDADTFEVTIEDNASPQFRLKSSGTSAQFVVFGEHAITASCARDFESRAEFDAYKALTAQSITFVASKGAESITILMPSMIKDDYSVNIGGQSDVVRAEVSYQGTIDVTGKTYVITIICAENIT